MARLCTIVSHPLKTKVFSVFTTQISLVISHRADLWSRPMSHFRQQICYWNKKPWQKKHDFYLYLKLCQMGYEFSTKVFKVPTPHIHLHLIFEISSLKNLVRWTGFFVYFKLNFYCMCSLQKSSLKYRIVASTNTCYYSENQVFGGVTIRVLCSKRGCY